MSINKQQVEKWVLVENLTKLQLAHDMIKQARLNLNSGSEVPAGDLINVENELNNMIDIVLAEVREKL